jgi:hypothetical protein
LDLEAKTRVSKSEFVPVLRPNLVNKKVFPGFMIVLTNKVTVINHIINPPTAWSVYNKPGGQVMNNKAVQLLIQQKYEEN